MENAKDSRQMTEEERVRKKTCQNHNKFELVKLYFFLKSVNFYHYCFNKFFLFLIDLKFTHHKFHHFKIYSSVVFTTFT